MRSLQALDRVLVEASQRGIYVILSLTDFYGAFGSAQSGFEPYLQVGRGPVSMLPCSCRLACDTAAARRASAHHSCCAAASR